MAKRRFRVLLILILVIAIFVALAIILLPGKSGASLVWSAEKPGSATVKVDGLSRGLFLCSSASVTREDNGESVVGGPVTLVKKVYLADINGDGVSEICAEVDFGSGIVDSHIEVYDPVAFKSYTLTGRSESFDWFLDLKDGVLCAYKTPYSDYSVLVESGRLALKRGELVIE